jgi:hypothetical protein
VLLCECVNGAFCAVVLDGRRILIRGAASLGLMSRTPEPVAVLFPLGTFAPGGLRLRRVGLEYAPIVRVSFREFH